MSGDRTSPRYDVVATTRRFWSKQQKKAIVAEIDIGGATLSEVARRYGIHSSLLFRWRKALGAVTGVPPIDDAAARSTPPAPSFVPVMLPRPSAPWTNSATMGMIEIVLAGGRMVRVGSDVDTSALVRLIEALEKGR